MRRSFVSPIAIFLLLLIGTSTAVSLRGLSQADVGSQIVGGIDVDDKARYPYMVNLRSSSYGPKYCGGSLIAPNVVLSAAHCLGAETVTIGKWDFSLDQPEDFDVRTVEAQVTHPQYSSFAMENDIMLIKLSEASTKTPIAINLDGEANLNQMLNVQGWGTLQSGGAQPDRLQEVAVSFVSNSDCNGKYGGGITEDMMCAASPGKDSCQGDSGGPLIIKGANAEADIQVGVVSWGYGCADPNYPGVYARVSAAQSFIEQTLTGWGIDITNPSPGPGPSPPSSPQQLSPAQQFAAAEFDLSSSSITFSAETYAPCFTSGITALPEDVSGSTPLDMGDDDSTLITFAGDFSFPYYGTTYSSAHVGSNGFVTFGSGDTTYSPTLDAHFAQPRISALFDDLSPAIGTISWKQLQDRVVITYAAVPHYSRPDTSTFQVVLKADGSITLAYLDVFGGSAKLVGLSGGSKPNGWIASDLSASATCPTSPSPSPPATTSAPTPAPTSMASTPAPTTMPPVGTPPPRETTLECLAPGELNIQHLSSSILVTCVLPVS